MDINVPKTITENNEKWKRVSGYDRYFVSNLGRIYSTIRSGRILSQTRNNKGYLYVSLMKLNSSYPDKKLVHRLVADAFCKKGNGCIVNHIDGCKQNNNAENLEFCSYSENNEHAKKNGLQLAYGENHYASKLTLEDIQEIKKRVSEGEFHKTVAKDFGISRRHVGKIVNNQAWVRAKNAVIQ